MRYLLIYCIDETVELSPADDFDVEGSAAARAEQAWVAESAAPQVAAVIAAASARVTQPGNRRALDPCMGQPSPADSPASGADGASWLGPRARLR
jgi:hypothetical protein